MRWTSSSSSAPIGRKVLDNVVTEGVELSRLFVVDCNLARSQRRASIAFLLDRALPEAVLGPVLDIAFR